MCLTQFISSMYVFMPIFKLCYHCFISRYSVNVNVNETKLKITQKEIVLKSGTTDQHKLKLHVTLTEKNSCFMNIKDLQVETFSNKITYWSSKASQLPASKQAQAL